LDQPSINIDVSFSFVGKLAVHLLVIIKLCSATVEALH